MSQSTAQSVPQSVNSAEDILIVGAGPAGATTALFLAKSGIPHTLIDRATFPRDKADGNVYGSKVIEVLDRLSLDYFPELVAQSDQVLGCRSAHIFTPSRQRFDVHVPASATQATIASPPAAEVPFFTMNRRAFDYFLVQKLDPAYTQQHLGTALETIERHQDRWRVVVNTGTEQQECFPRLVVVADGANSTLLPQLGHHISTDRFYDSIQGYFRGVTGFEADQQQAQIHPQAAPVPTTFHIEGHFLPESSPGFFFIVPLAGGVFNVGVGIPRQTAQQHNIDLRDLLHRIIQKSFAERFAQAEAITDLRSWPIPIGASGRPPISGAGYVVTGDAVGLCNPLTCYGTGNAMISGLLAAQQIQRCVEQQQFDEATLKDYDHALYDRLQKEFRHSSVLKAFTQQHWLFNLVAKPSVKSVLRPGLKRTAAMMKQL
ncbi:MAG: NAD(P)/FAD-dependent oxidoreductase [Cyanobacteria bacterium J06648_16]